MAKPLQHLSAHEPVSPDDQDAFGTLLRLSSEWYWEQDSQFRFTRLIGDEVHKLGIAPLLLGKRRWESNAVPVGNDGSWDAHKATLAAHQPFRDFLYSLTRVEGAPQYISATGEPVFDPDGTFIGYRGVAKEVTRRVLDDQMLRLEHAVTRRLAAADSLYTGIPAVIQTICESEGWECGDYWEIDEAAGVRRIRHSWGIAESPIQRFMEASRDMTVSIDNGQVGKALASGRPNWVADMTAIRRSTRAKFAADAGMRALFVLPIKAGGRALGALGFNSRRIREPDERFLQAVIAIGDQIGQFLQRKRAEEIVRESEERFRSLTQLSSDTYWEQDEEYRFTAIQGVASAGLEARRDLLLGKRRWEQNYINIGSAQWAEHIATLDARKPFRDLELCRINHTGEKTWTSTAGEPVFDRSGRFKGYRGIGKDITARKAAEERIQYLAHHDALTALPNRTMFGELLHTTLALAQRHHRKFAVMFIDLDRFKIINDTLGHEAGDELLTEASHRLRQAVRESDIVARLGGDEFVILLQEIDGIAQVEMVAQRVLSSVTKPLMIADQECRVTASIGISVYPEGGQSEQELMKNADIAMYHAKESGKNNYQFYSNQRNVPSLERLALETSLRKALAREEFLLHYQAKLDLHTNRITGVEALLRWQHPDLGMVSPAKFIPLAEETGLIVPIGKWVLRTACAQTVAWQREGLPPVCMAVNISARQFHDERLLDDVRQALAETGLEPHLLELELTESMVMQDITRATRVLAAIKGLGVRLAIDDFGVGYSSLANIKRFPIDTLKLDRSFIRGIPADSEDKAITEAIIAMGRTLSLTVVAEGVETREQQAFLQQHACDEMQGFYFNKPIGATEFSEFLRSHTEVSCAA